MKSFLYFLSLMLFLSIVSCGNDNIEDEMQQEELTIAVNEGLEQQVIQEVNEFRVSKGLNALAYSEDAYQYAEAQTHYMIRTGSLNHDSFDERASSLSKSTNAIKVAENVAKGYATAKDVVEGWILSEGHYINLVGSYSHTAVSVAENSEGVLYYTQIFYQGSD